ncbi:hypothetical protein CDAR_303551 [Caerostris darwini]|uniref:Uncharacterized protein n=1 Tax=Caerostris darwini TaxID=1538125 RepID=A0AAV4WV13_9ARAC|nr:hypothetical protein CDAR_303551 [Caerostris darwini]
MLFMPRTLFQTVRKMDGEEEAFLLEALTPLVRRGVSSNQRSVVDETALFQKLRSSAHYYYVFQSSAAPTLVISLISKSVDLLRSNEIS